MEIKEKEALQKLNSLSLGDQESGVEIGSQFEGVILSKTKSKKEEHLVDFGFDDDASTVPEKIEVG